MGFFDKFRDTVFLKEDSNLEKDLNMLINIRDQVVEKDKIDIDIKKLQMGLQGENQIAYELKTSDLGMYVLRDITIPYQDLTAQIDYFVITPACMYVIECKNLIGNVTVDNKGEFIREYYINDKKIKEAFYSPYRQALRHVELLKKRWLEAHNIIDRLLFEKAFNKSYKPLVVFSNPQGILNINDAPSEIKNHIVKIDQLNAYLKKDYDNTDSLSYYSQRQMLENAQSLLEKNIVKENNNIINKYTLKSIENTNNNDVSIINSDIELENKLREYRMAKSKDKNIPAYCVFNNKEMALIIKNKPKTLEELKALHILNDTKLKYNGQEIINIINNQF